MASGEKPASQYTLMDSVHPPFASGNVVLDTSETPTSTLATRFEKLLAEQHGLSTGMGRSKLSIPKTVGVGTVRNWNTVSRLLKLSGG